MLIAVLLSTYNGETYLKEQLDSIISQTLHDWKLFIRDDGSKDQTIKIINEYITKYKDKIVKINDNLGNLKSASSFMYLLEKVNADYYMFCDQDDIWFKNKIEITLEKIQNLESKNINKPILVFTNLHVVNNELITINESMWEYSNINPENAKDFYKTTCLSSVTGCTIMINKKLKDKVLPYSTNARMHDWWISLNAAYYGKVGYISDPTIFYRQHENNVIGAEKLNSNYYLSKIKSLKKTIKENIEVYKMLKSLNFKVNFIKVILTKIKIISTK
jgi:glycosyltransferase involved in cell wall biosynthesis